MSNELIPVSPEQDAILSNILLTGNIGKLNDVQRWEYTKAICNRLKLDPYTQPFRILKLNGVEVLYATKAACEQLVKIYNVTSKLGVMHVDVELGICRVECTVNYVNNGRATSAMAAVPIVEFNPKGEQVKLKPEALCNALMKCETKAFRRAVLRLVGLGMMDETEAETMGGEHIDIEARDVSAITALDEDLASQGKLTVGQRKECVALSNEISDERDAFESAEDYAEYILNQLNFDITQETITDCLDAINRYHANKAERKEATAAKAGKRVPKGGAKPAPKDVAVEVSATSVPSAEVPAPATEVDELPKSSDEQSDDGEQQSAPITTSTPEVVSDAENCSTSKPVVDRSSVPSLKAIMGKPLPDSNAAVAETDASATTASKIGTSPDVCADATEPEYVASDEALRLYAEFTDHIALNKDLGKPPTWTKEFVEMVKPIANAAGWDAKKAPNALFHEFGIHKDALSKSGFLTWELFADMATYFIQNDPNKYEIR